MKLAALLTACCLTVGIIGCESTEESSSSVAPAALGECCAEGTCADAGSCGEKVAPGAVSEGACSEAAACPMSGTVAPAAVSDCASSCSEAKSCDSDSVSMGAVSEGDCASACSAAKSCSSEG